MMMESKVIAGDYEGCGIRKANFGLGLLLESKSGATIMKITKYKIQSIEDMGNESRHSLGQALFGSVLFGPAGLLLGGNNRRHYIAIFWKDGKKSLADLNDIEYRELIKVTF